MVVNYVTLRESQLPQFLKIFSRAQNVVTDLKKKLILKLCFKHVEMLNA